MARGVTSEARSISVHQALHGYADGHRLISASLELKSKDAKTVLTISDASGPTSTLDPRGYLTGYPLPDAGYYALARTWPAPEMPRPGCVWTHTLLVSFSDLAALPMLSVLETAFRRPPSTDRADDAYSQPLQITGQANALTPDPRLLVIARRILWSMYSRPRDRIVSGDGNTEERDSVALSLWSQQWPRLRRTFRFCTLTSADRSTDGAPFDVQFLPADRASRSRFAELFEADREPPETPPWLEYALRDLVAVEETPLRSFLRESGAELDGGRELFIPLCETHRLLNDIGKEPRALHEAIRLVETTLGADAAPALHRQIVRAVLEVPAELGPSELSFLARYAALIPPEEHTDFVGRVAPAIWQSTPAILLTMLDATEPTIRHLASQSISALPATALVEGLGTSGIRTKQILALRPDLLEQTELWNQNDGVVRTALDTLQASSQVPSSILDAMIASANETLPSWTARHIDDEEVLSRVIVQVSKQSSLSAANATWLRAHARPNAVAAVLSKGEVKTYATYAVLLRIIDPDAVTNDYGVDPCLTAAQKAGEPSTQIDRMFISAWLLARGVGRRTRSPAELITFGLDEVYMATVRSRLPNDCWSLLAPRMPDSSFWGEWDRGKRIRVGVIKTFVDRDLSPLLFGQLLRDDSSFADFADETIGVTWGYGYLKRVKRALRDLDDDRYSRRIAILKRLV